MHSVNTSPLLHIYSYWKTRIQLCDCNVVSTNSTNILIFPSIPHRILKKLGSAVLAVYLAFPLLTQIDIIMNCLSDLKHQKDCWRDIRTVGWLRKQQSFFHQTLLDKECHMHAALL